jgi:hypothetical protein
MNHLTMILTLEGILVMLTDLTAFAIILRIYLKNRRRSALAFSVAWLFDFLTILGTSINEPYSELLSVLALPTFSCLIFYGAVKFLEEESISVKHDTLALLSVMAPTFMVYMLGVYYYTHDAIWTATVASSLGISGVFVISGGVLLWELREIYQMAVKYLAVGVILFGFHLVPAALFGLKEWYKGIGFSLSTVLIVFMVWAMVKMTSSEAFLFHSENGGKEIEVKSGVMILKPEEYEKIKEELSETPVLAFLRDIANVPDKWETYFVTTIPFQGNFKDTINPTNLAKMTEIVYQYLEAISKSGKHGIVVIDCLEYLVVYNSWESIMKFLTKLRDLILVSGGTLILVVEEGSIGRERYLQLRKLLG